MSAVRVPTQRAVDHLLPKADYPAFVVYSRNLVPACKCNGKKSTKLLGAGAGERILHPYFDDCLLDRILAARFEDHGPTPRISLNVLADGDHPMKPTILFHVAHVVEKTGIKRYLLKCWTRLCRQPLVAVSRLDPIPTTPAQLETILMAELARTDAYRESKNNWDSVFLAGSWRPPHWLGCSIASTSRGARPRTMA